MTQFRVLVALLLRETRATFGTSQIGYAWAIITPAVGVGLLVFIFSQVGRAAPFGHSLALFFATGYLLVEFFNRLSTTLMTGIEANKSLLTYPLVGEIDVLFARAFLITMTYTLIMTLFFGTMWALGLAGTPRDPVALIEAFLATAWLGMGFGFFNAALIGIWDAWRHIEKVLTRPLIFISGVFYVPSLLPQQAVDLLWWNPLVHLVDWFRTGFYPTYPDAILTPWWPLALGGVFFLIGLSVERFTRSFRRLA